MAAGRTPLPTAQASSSSDATPSSLGWGVRSSGPVDKTEAQSTTRVDTENTNVNADHQMATPAEGEVADAVDRKSGIQRAPGEGEIMRDDFSEGIDRKKKEQAQARKQVKEERRAGIDIDGSLGQARAGNEDNSVI